MSRALFIKVTEVVGEIETKVEDLPGLIIPIGPREGFYRRVFTCSGRIVLFFFSATITPHGACSNALVKYATADTQILTTKDQILKVAVSGVSPLVSAAFLDAPLALGCIRPRI